jgi:hypothetical protein
MPDHLGPINTIDLIVVGSSSGSEADELDTGAGSDSDDSDSGSTSKSEQSVCNLNSHATEQFESVVSDVNPAPISRVGKNKRGRPSKG